MNKEKGKPLVLILPFEDEQGRSCPLKGEELKKCPIYQEKRKKADIISAVPRPPGQINPLTTITLDCIDRCPYLPTGEGDET
ncbi:MAG: hypothetical protein U9R03_03775 [Candidatus Aerophobetes bacterium]|nr:hypothetical protein [Candidatus Aerophobetes bacterium]